MAVQAPRLETDEYLKTAASTNQMTMNITASGQAAANSTPR